MLQHPSSGHITPPKGWSYREPSTGVEFRSTCLNAMQNDVFTHRRVMKLDLAFDWIQRWLDELCRQNPKLRCEPNPRANGFELEHVWKGRAMWKELHAFADTQPMEPQSTEQESTRDWFNGWLSRVPHFNGCACRENFLHIMNDLPPRFDGAFRQWCVDAHNRVSALIGKPRYRIAGIENGITTVELLA